MTGRIRKARFPLHDLEALIGWPIHKDLAAELGVSLAAVKGWATRGVTYLQADDLAGHFGLHPLEVWGPDWLEPYVPPGHPRAEWPAREAPTGYCIGSTAEKQTRLATRRRELSHA